MFFTIYFIETIRIEIGIPKHYYSMEQLFVTLMLLRIRSLFVYDIVASDGETTCEI